MSVSISLADTPAAGVPPEERKASKAVAILWFAVILPLFGLYCLVTWLLGGNPFHLPLLIPMLLVTVVIPHFLITGGSHLYRRRGGASGCLHLVVTPDELWVTVGFPFSVFVEHCQLEHCIVKRDITRLELAPIRFSREKCLTLTFDARPEPVTLLLRPRNLAKFLAALDHDGELKASGRWED